jgi:hypothetical protein
MDDVTLLDSEHKKNKATVSDKAKDVPAAKNKFNNFNQRTYDYNQLEKELLDIK